jgi:hypothetical protein
MRIGKVQSDMHEDIKGEVGGNKERLREFWVDEHEMGLENVQWVVVDEADVLLSACLTPAMQTFTEARWYRSGIRRIYSHASR